MDGGAAFLKIGQHLPRGSEYVVMAADQSITLQVAKLAAPYQATSITPPMNDQPNSDPSQPTPPPPADGVKEATDKALALAKDGVATLKKLDLPAQIYLGGLALAFLCAVFFDVISIKLTMAGAPIDGALFGGISKSLGSYPAYKTNSGILAALAALGGIWIWNHKSGKNNSWVPKALAGCAGLSALMYLVLMFNSRPSSSLEMVEVNVDMTLLGFWLPFAGAVAATVVAVRRLKTAA